MSRRPSTVLCLVLIAGLVSACTPKFLKLDSVNRDRLQQKDRPIGVIRYSLPTLNVPASMPWGMMFGLLGEAFSFMDAHSRGEAIIEKTGLTDPMASIQETFIDYLRDSGAAGPFEILPDLLEQDADGFSGLQESSPWPLVLDFQTVKWGVKKVFLEDFYQVTYVGRVRLLDLKQEKFLWQGACDLTEKDSQASPSFQEFLENEGALLKASLNSLGQACLQTLQEQFQGSTNEASNP